MGPQRKKWLHEEDSILKKLLKKQEEDREYNWDRIAYEMKEHKYDKTAKQCRERFQNHLNPQLNHVKFNMIENQKLIKIFGDIGNKWKEIASHFPGRVDNTIKNQFFSLVRKGFRNANK